MIRLSLNSYCLAHLPWDEVLDQTRALGYRRLEIPTFVHPDAFSPETLTAAFLREALASRDLELIALYPPPIDIHSPDRLKRSIDGVKRTVDLAGELGCRLLVFPPLLPREGYDYAKLAEACLVVDQWIDSRDIEVCLENHAGWPLSVGDDYERLFRDLDGRAAHLRITLDTGHFTGAGEDPVAFARRFLPRIGHLHLKDHVGTRNVRFGEGETDNRGVVDVLRAAGYDGHASVEIETGNHATALKDLADARSYAADRLGIRD